MNKTLKVIVAGSRDFDDYDLVKSKLDVFLSKTTDKIVIVSGTCRGPDQLGERYAKEKGYDIERHPADWDKYGRRAGPVRNEEMAQSADCLVAFWDGKSKGTENMLNLANKYNLKIRIVKI